MDFRQLLFLTALLVSSRHVYSQGTDLAVSFPTQLAMTNNAVIEVSQVMGDFVTLTVSRQDKAISLEALVPQFLASEDLVELKLLIYSRFISQYPFLKNLPKERFKALFTFNFKIDYVTSIVFKPKSLYLDYQNFFMAFHLENSPAIYDESVKAPPHSEKRIAPLPSHALSEVIQAGDYCSGGRDVHTPILVLKDNAREKLFAVAAKFDFASRASASQLRERILIAHPELRTYFNLDDLLNHALSDPSALTGHLKTEILSAQAVIRAQVQSQEITRVEGERRLDILRASIARTEEDFLEKTRSLLGIQALIAQKEARLETMEAVALAELEQRLAQRSSELEQNYMSQNTELAQKIAELEKTYAHRRAELESEIAALKSRLQIMESETVAVINAQTSARRAELKHEEAQFDLLLERRKKDLTTLNESTARAHAKLRDLIDANTVGQKIVPDVQNVEIISGKSEAETRELRSKISAFVRAHLSEELRTTQLIHHEAWSNNRIFIELALSLEAFETRKKTQKNWLGREKQTNEFSYVIQIGVSAHVRSPVSQQHLVDHFTLVLENGALTLPPESAESKRIFFREIADAAMSVGHDYQLNRAQIVDTVTHFCTQLLKQP